ncbi:unnamed protein product [Amoebophrya sp. A25]|nr:unnamed protein product [Amoebophrya sp. A25]|eukprot:GSA25T00009905001.1
MYPWGSSEVPPAQRRDFLGRLYYENHCDNSAGCVLSDFALVVVQLLLVRRFLSSNGVSARDGSRNADDKRAGPGRTALRLYSWSWYTVLCSNFAAGLYHMNCTAKEQADKPLDFAFWLVSGVLLVCSCALLFLLSLHLVRHRTQVASSRRGSGVYRGSELMKLKTGCSDPNVGSRTTKDVKNVDDNGVSLLAQEQEDAQAEVSTTSETEDGGSCTTGSTTAAVKNKRRASEGTESEASTRESRSGSTTGNDESSSDDKFGRADYSDKIVTSSGRAKNIEEDEDEERFFNEIKSSPRPPLGGGSDAKKAGSRGRKWRTGTSKKEHHQGSSVGNGVTTGRRTSSWFTASDREALRHPISIAILLLATTMSGVHMIFSLHFIVLGITYLLAWISIAAAVVWCCLRQWCEAGGWNNKSSSGVSGVSFGRSALAFGVGWALALVTFAVFVKLGSTCDESWIYDRSACALDPVMPHINHNTLAHLIFLLATPFLIGGGGRTFASLVSS